ncbi:hypothetical protein COCNU_13G006070 [Cocos nucifera]|uniref:Uncharacterized protein n=1 Tax=Cocos nucifera TaxID=13894 RepID=A0A8K0IT97_COCNU|nr:hypothetical protein COCNU_13G006070 [Cocos nucifera]
MESPPKESLIGIKRKAVSENLLDQAPQGNHDQKQLPEQHQDWAKWDEVASFWCNLCKVNCDGNEVNGSKNNTFPKPGLIGIKQEVVSEDLPEGMFYGSQDQRLLPKQLQGIKAFIIQLIAVKNGVNT